MERTTFGRLAWMIIVHILAINSAVSAKCSLKAIFCILFPILVLHVSMPLLVE